MCTKIQFNFRAIQLVERVKLKKYLLWLFVCDSFLYFNKCLIFVRPRPPSQIARNALCAIQDGGRGNFKEANRLFFEN